MSTPWVSSLRTFHPETPAPPAPGPQTPFRHDTTSPCDSPNRLPRCITANSAQRGPRASAQTHVHSTRRPTPAPLPAQPSPLGKHVSSKNLLSEWVREWFPEKTTFGEGVLLLSTLETPRLAPLWCLVLFPQAWDPALSGGDRVSQGGAGGWPPGGVLGERLR